MIETVDLSDKKRIITILKEKREKLEDGFPSKASIQFLEAVANGKCVFGASKGDGLCWAAEGNGGTADDIANDLLPYFLDMWKERVIFAFNGVIILSNGEDEAKTKVVEIRLTSDAESKVCQV